MAAAPARNLLSLQQVGRSYGTRDVLADVSLGLSAGERIGIVGRNGDGKSTLLRLIAGLEEPDAGVVTRSSELDLVMVGQGDDLDPAATIRHELVGDLADHEWAADPRIRGVLDGLLGGVALDRFPDGLDTTIGPLSGGERRRIALARALLTDVELLLLDEPTNHLDVEGVDWLARHLAARRGTVVVITHDRWFLDAVCTRTWEVVDRTVHQFEGGYAAWVLARAERDRQAAASESRRRNLLRKELAWLRRGPPARTSKPKFRTDAAQALIADEPEPRDRVELLRFAASRLGDRVLDVEDVSVSYGDRSVLDHLTWRLGPGDRVALVGVNGSGKTTLVRLVAGEQEPDTGRVDRGTTVRLAHLTQDMAEVDGDLRVIESLEQVRQTTTTSDGYTLTAGQLVERFGFKGPRAYARVRELSGGERRRLQLMRLMMEEPNVLLLDEPTNDLDIDTLTALEDLLDSWPGTLVVVSHDRYFVERVCDDVYAIAAGGDIRHLPRGIDQYVEERRVALEREQEQARGAAAATDQKPAASDGPTNAQRQQARKDVQRLERQLERVAEQEQELHDQMAASADDHVRVAELDRTLREATAERERLEEAWLAASELLDG
ncbi:MAG: ABC-F family ATP-binding cassette domain-containing protein [Thermoleophilia bacterium]|nr:ABC-F family ATP-binding cassette domain-containing protein [Thermoleophilia bacterium]